MAQKTIKQNTSGNNFTEKIIVLDADRGVLGRVAAFAAKQALLGKSVKILNCEKAIVTGSRGSAIKEYMAIRNKGGSSFKGPFFPKHTDKIMKRTIRGMLPYKQGRGELAFSKIRCYNGIPAEFTAAKKLLFHRKLTTATTTLADISDKI
ncbi:MAG: 50S ribosomal protein L13 [archaeon]